MILVTGATGFLGSMLVKELQALSLDVIPLHFGTDAVIAHNYWQADLTRIDHLEKLALANKIPETVIHLAGYIDIALQPDSTTSSYGSRRSSCGLVPHHERGIESALPDEPIERLEGFVQDMEKNLLPPIPNKQDIAFLYAANVGGTANLIDYCLEVGVKHVIFASTQAVYGMPQGILTEESTCQPLEHYAASKLCAEQLLEVASKQGLQVTIARFPGLYAQHRSSGVVYNFCKTALQKKEIIVTCNYPLPLDVIHMQDVIDAFIKMTQVKNHQFLRLNIATGQPCSLNLLADNVAKLIPECRVTHTAISQPVVIMDASLAQKILDWQPIPQAERLQQMLNAIKSNQQLNTVAMYERFL